MTACLRKFVIELAYKPFVKNLTSERASIYYTKKDVLKNRFFFELLYVSCILFTS